MYLAQFHLAMNQPSTEVWLAVQNTTRRPRPFLRKVHISPHKSEMRASVASHKRIPARTLDAPRMRLAARLRTLPMSTRGANTRAEDDEGAWGGASTAHKRNLPSKRKSLKRLGGHLPFLQQV